MPDNDLSPVPDDLEFGQTIRGFIPDQQVFGRYTLREIVGRGGMGLVWLAQDEHLKEDVALKFLPELVRLDDLSLEELKRETRRSRKLAHNNIVKVYDFVSDATSAAISMEFVQGATLSGLRARQEQLCFEVDEVRDWLRQLLNALIYAHEQAKIVHRDLKPANVMVDETGQVKVTDFGIASSISESVSRVTVQRGTSGTLAYMSPQQATGREGAAISDDIYSLGATIFELLAGKPPFFKGEIYQQLLHETPVSMTARRAQLGIEGVAISAEWEATIAACLAKEPEQRPQSMLEVAHGLGLPVMTFNPGDTRPATTSIPVTTPPEPPPSGSKKGLLIAGLVVVLLALGGLGYYFGVMVPAEKARQAEIAKQEEIQKEKELEAQQAASAAEKAKLEAEAQKAAADAEALRTQQEKEKQEADAKKAADDAEAARLAAARGGVMVKTDPEGATIAIGGEDVQTSPANFKSLHLGKYPVHITLDGYEPVDQGVEVKENDFVDMGTITLARSKGTLQIVTTPADADYTISNATLGVNKSGKTPDTIQDLPVGTYDVTVKRGDWAIPGTATVKRNDTVVYSPVFAYGSATITSEPSDASISEKGKGLGKTPVTLKDLQVGSHIFTLALSGYKPSSVSVDVGASGVTTGSASLEKVPLGSASLTSEPSGATVSEHGKELGQTPLTLKELSLGKHTFSFALSGYKTTSTSADITADNASDVSATLESIKRFAGTWVGQVKDYNMVFTVIISPDEMGATVPSYGSNEVDPVQIKGNTLTFHSSGGLWTFVVNGDKAQTMLQNILGHHPGSFAKSQ